MAKTTIDGLAVRSKSARSSARASGNVARAKSAKPKASSDVRKVSASARATAVAKTKARSIARTKQAAQGVPVVNDIVEVDSLELVNDFVQPVEELDLGEDDKELATESSADWSDLLDELDDKPKKDDFLEDKKSEADWLKDEEEKKPVKKAKPAKKSKKKRGAKVRTIILCVILGLVAAAGVALFIWGDSLISRMTNGNSGLFDALFAMVSDEVPFEADANGRTNVLVFGTEGYDMGGSTGGGGTHDGAQLTDSIMVISFDQETKDVALLSLPRDLKVSMACSAGKVNEVFYCHNKNGTDEEAGARALMKQLGEILGIEFQYWAHVNWGSLIEIIDTLGGITVTFDEDISDRYYTGAMAKAGEPVYLTGEKALAFARARHGTGGGDFTRGNSQQKIVEGIIQKVIDQGLGLTEALNLLNILGDNLHSNFSTDNIKSGISMMGGFDPGTMRNVPLVNYTNGMYYVKTANINGISYVVPSAGVGNYSKIQSYIARMFSSNPAVIEGANIAVYNATEAQGVAAGERAMLEADGYPVAKIGDADPGDCDRKYCVYDLNGNMPRTQAALDARYWVDILGADDLPADIPADVDFVIIVGKVEE